MNYSEQLKSPMWQKKRLEIMQRDNFTCQDCGCTNSQLQVHHKSYIFNNKVWEYDDANFITLCETCHSWVTDLKKGIKLDIDNCFYSTGELMYLHDIIKSLSLMDKSDLSQIVKFANFIFEQNSKQLNENTNG